MFSRFLMKNNTNHMTNRRLFIKQISALSLLSMNGNLFAGNENNILFEGNRETLKEAGPMIPPVPAILLTVNGLENNPAEISVVWTFVINGKPPQIGISVEDPHMALAMIKHHKEFVLNVPTIAMVEGFDKVDMKSSKIADKFAISGFTKGKAQTVNAPTIVESPIHVECKVIHEFRVEPIRTVFIAEVTATTVLPNVCDANGKLIVGNVDFFGMTAGSGEFYTMGKKVGHIGKSVGRDNIKY